MDTLISLISAAAGAFGGTWAAFQFAWYEEKSRKTTRYLTLLLYLYNQLESLWAVFSEVDESLVKEIDGEKVVKFDIPFSELDITAEQMETLFEVSPDKDMPASLVALQSFLKSNTHRIARDGFLFLSLEDVKQYEWQLRGMLLSIRVQYEQQTKSDFPCDDLTNTPYQTTQQTSQ